MGRADRSATATLVDAIRGHSDGEADRSVFTFLRDGETDSVRLTYGDLDRRAQEVAAELEARVAPGERVVLLLPPGPEFITSFLGCHYGATVAVPTFSPERARPERMAARLGRILKDCGAQAVLTDQATLARGVVEQLPEFADIHWIAVESIGAAERAGARTPAASDLALLQYTSGSTAAPRGVMVTHANLAANLTYLVRRLDIGRDTEGALWLPPYHDMGLIGGILLACFNGHHITLMSPWHFLQRPLRWLEALSRTHSTHSAAPDFTLKLCVESTTEEERARLDLSSLRMLLSGGEPVLGTTIERFTSAFAVSGLDPAALTPAYGLAESTLMVSTAEVEAPASVTAFEAGALEQGKARPQSVGDGPTRTLVSCGRPDQSTDLRIVDPQTALPVADGQVGEIWVRSASVARGYWGLAEDTATVFGAHLADTRDGRYLRTGDLGFLIDGELYVAGRLKDVVIIRGRNHYPQDLESVAEGAHSALTIAGGAAFTVEDGGEQRLVLVHEVDGRVADQGRAIAVAIRQAIAVEHDVLTHRVVLIPQGKLPKTASGKVQRDRTRRLLMSGQLPIVADERLPLPARSRVQRPQDLAAWLADEIGTITGERPSTLDLDTPLTALGLDSVAVADLVQRVEAAFGTPLSIDDIPAEVSPRDLAAYLAPTQEAPADADGVARAPARFQDLPEFHALRAQLDGLAGARNGNPFSRGSDGVAAATALVDGREVTNFASYNYLGLNGHPEVSAAAQRAIEVFGTSVSASRLAFGERSIHSELEEALAAFLGTERCLVFVSGNLTNVTTLGHIATRGDLIVHDALAHDSIVQGARLSGAARRAFAHNDHRALDRLLASVRHRYDRVVIVIEGVYSMDGDVPDLPAFLDVKRRHGAYLMVDEAHSLGVLGPTGRGLAERFGVDAGEIEISMGTLSKALASCGGYIAGCAEFVDYLRLSAPGFVFSVGLPPASTAAALAALQQLQAEPFRVEQVRKRAAHFLKLARARGLPTGLSEGSAVVPVIVGRTETALAASSRLLARGVNVQPIVYPAVEEAGARLRFFICADHTEEQILEAVNTTAEVLAELQDAPPAGTSAQRVRESL